MAHWRRSTWVRLGLFTAAMGAIAAVGLAPTAASARDGEGGDHHGGDSSVIYNGSVRYVNHCPDPYNGPNTSLTSMDSSDSQKGCQASYNGGREVLYSDCSRTRNDHGSWFYKPTAGQDGGFVFNGSFHEQNQIEVSSFNSATGTYTGTYSGTEDFTDPGKGTVHQEYSATVTGIKDFPNHCTVNASNWHVVTKGTDELSFLTSSTNNGPPPTDGKER